MRSIGANGATAVAIAVGEEADKDKKRRRRNRGSKKNTSPEGALSNPMNSICGPPPELLENGSGVLGAHPLYVTPTPLKLPETTFSSLPPIHIFEDHAGSSEVQEEVSQISQSCPVPSTSYFTPVKSREFTVASKEERRKWFDPYWLDHAIEDAIMVLKS